jgi:hypothetical protein
MDETSYTPGPPSNVLRLVKKRPAGAAVLAEGEGGPVADAEVIVERRTS